MNFSFKNTLFLVGTAGIISIASTCGMHKGHLSGMAHHEVSQMEVIVNLASDQMEGREVGKKGGDMSAEYIKSEMSKLALTPKGDKGDFIQEFSFKPISMSPHGTADDMSLGMAPIKEIHGKNILGMIDNSMEKTIVIGAHYDHLGWGNDFSLFKGDSAIHNGADDNASGVAAMLKLASDIKNNPEAFKAHNYLFIAFSGEEYGLIGSKLFCENPTVDLKKVHCMLNFDMVGRLKDDKGLAVYGVGTSPHWKRMIEEQNKDFNFKLVYEESGVGPSDHTSFYLMDIPVLHFFTGQHEDYHKPSDDISKLNFEGLAEVTNFVFRLTADITKQSDLEFTKTKDAKDEEMSFKVTLGVIPDYMYNDGGMRIDGVTEGRPASNAGMLKGDVVIKIGDTDVPDMMAYMKCLGEFEEGDSTVVRVKRGDKELDLNVTWD